MTASRLRWRWLEWLINLSAFAIVVGAGVMVAVISDTPTGIDVCQRTSAGFDDTCPPAEFSPDLEPTLIVTEDVTLGSHHEGPIWIEADGVTLDCAGHHVRGGGQVGIYVLRHSAVTIKDCTVSGFDTGILLDRSTSSVVTGNIAKANDTGFSVSLGNSNQLTGNTAELNRVGFHISGSDDTLLDGNTTRLGLVGVRVADSKANTLEENEIIDAHHQGMEVENAVGSIIKGNHFVSPLHAGTTAVALAGVSGAVLSDNRVAAGHMGFSVRRVTDSIFESNLIANAGRGFEIRNSRRNTFTDNEIADADTPMWGLAMTLDNDFADNLGAHLYKPMRLVADHTLEADHVGRIVIAADDITVDCAGHEIRAPGWAPGVPPNRIEVAIEVSHHTGVTIENCDVVGYEHGVVLWHADENTIRNNTSGVDVRVSNRNQVSGNKATRVIVKGSDHNTITDCTVTEGGDIKLLDARNNTVEGNMLGRWSLLSVRKSSRNTVTGNVIAGGRMNLQDAKNNTIAGNTVTPDQDYAFAAFIVGEGSANNLVADNLAQNGKHGFRLNKNSNNTYRNNVTVGNEVGFRLIETSGNTFEGNDATGSGQPITIDGSDDNTYVDNIGF